MRTLSIAALLLLVACHTEHPDSGGDDSVPGEYYDRDDDCNGLVGGGRLTLNNVRSTWNTASDNGGGVLVVDGQLTEVNATHGGDDATVGGGLHLHGTSTGSVMNTIVYGAATGHGVYGDSTATSICVDAGSPSSVYADTDGSRNDMGAHGAPGGSW